MPRIKERQKILHQPSTQEIFSCLEDMHVYSKILLVNSSDKPYAEFLNWLLEANFFNDRNGKINLTKLASSFKSETSKITKWIRQIYEDIFELNETQPQFFQTEGIKVTFAAKHNDNYCVFNTCLPLVPREFESIHFYFFKGKMGLYRFWVKNIEHSIQENIISTTINLESDYVNKYREFLLEKALFHEWIGFIDVYKKSSYEIDNDLRQFYKMYR
jgi:hypothetical protein